MQFANRDNPAKKSAPTIEIPHDVVNEQILIAAALNDADARNELVQKIIPSQFVEPAHLAIWAALLGLHEQGVEFGMATLYQACSAQGVELDYLERLCSSYPDPPASLNHHLSILRWDSIRAEAVKGPVAELIKALRDPLSSREKVRSLSRQIKAAFDQTTDRQFMADPMVLAREQITEMKYRKQRAVWPYGIVGFDVDERDTYRMIPGAAPGKITTLTGVSGAGKSVVAAVIALAQARMRRRVLYGAWEMGSGPTLELMALISLGWSRYVVSTGQLDDAQLGEFQTRMEQIGTYVRFFDAPFASQITRRYNNDEALDELHRCVADSGAEVTVLDLWERTIPDGDADAERRALFRTQQIFKETDCHGLLVCQQKLKEIENRGDKRPTRSTTLGSQAWIDISDTMIGIHRPGQWRPIGDDTMQFFILKQRFARWPLAVEFDWNGDLCTLTNCRSIEYDEIGKGGGFADDFLSTNGKPKRYGR